jgi:hypothetical protein
MKHVWRRVILSARRVEPCWDHAPEGRGHPTGRHWHKKRQKYQNDEANGEGNLYPAHLYLKIF